MAPNDHTSLLGQYTSFLLASGAIVVLFLRTEDRAFSSSRGSSFEKPSYEILKMPLWMRTFEGFRSLWTIPFLWSS